MAMNAAERLAQHLQGLTRVDMLAVSDRAGVPRKIGARARAARKVCASSYMQLCSAVGIDAVTGVPTDRVRPTGSSIVWWFFGSNLFLTRHLRRLDLRSAAELIGVSAATLSRAERGQPIAVDNFLRISEFIGIVADSFLCFTGNTNCNKLKVQDSAAAPMGASS
jgi:hypothetical protein